MLNSNSKKSHFKLINDSLNYNCTLTSGHHLEIFNGRLPYRRTVFLGGKKNSLGVPTYFRIAMSPVNEFEICVSKEYLYPIPNYMSIVLPFCRSKNLKNENC